MIHTGKVSVRSTLFETLFVRYGAGSKVFDPILKWRFWNHAAWTLIVLGIVGWAVALWLLRSV